MLLYQSNLYLNTNSILDIFNLISILYLLTYITIAVVLLGIVSLASKALIDAGKKAGGCYPCRWS